VLLFPERKRGATSSSQKHSHGWYKSLAGGFRCACEAWRCEFTAGSKLCDRASEHGRRFCLAHLVSNRSDSSSKRKPATEVAGFNLAPYVRLPSSLPL
jgi:hypothetical protein